MKKIFALFLCAALLLGVFSVGAGAATDDLLLGVRSVMPYKFACDVFRYIPAAAEWLDKGLGITGYPYVSFGYNLMYYLLLPFGAAANAVGGLFSPKHACRFCVPDYEIPVRFQSENLALGAAVTAEGKSAAYLLEESRKCWTPANEGDAVELQLAQTSTFNLAVIQELGEQVLYFRLQAWVGGAWQDIYRCEKIQRYRMCGFEPVTTDRVRLVIEKIRGDDSEPVRIKSIALYNEPRRGAQDFQVAAYTHLQAPWPGFPHKLFSEIVARGEADAWARYYDVYNTVILFQSIYFNDNGDLLYKNGEDYFARELAALKEIVARRTNPHEVKLTADFLSNASDFGSLGVNALMALHWEKIADQAIAFLRKYDLDGLAIDWEFPETEDDWRVHDSFVARLDDGLEAVKPGAIITGAYYPHAMGDMSLETAARFDRINYMAYDDPDRDGFNSNLSAAQGGVAAFHRRKNVDVGKINIGIGMYSKPNNVLWREQPGTNYWDCGYYNEQSGGYQGFCSPAVAGDKVTYALLAGAGGVMVWAFEFDLAADDPASIVGGMEDALKRYTTNW